MKAGEQEIGYTDLDVIRALTTAWERWLMPPAITETDVPKVLDTVPDGMVLVGFTRWDGDEFHDFVYATVGDLYRDAGFDGRVPIFAYDPELVPCPDHDDTEGPHHATECCMHASAFDA